MPDERAPVPTQPERPEPRAGFPAIPAFLRRRPDPGDRTAGPADPAAAPGPPDPHRLPIAMVSRRQLTAAVGLLLVAWIAIALVRQVGDAAAASSRADTLRDSNGALRSEVAALQAELGRVGDRRYVDLQARAFGLGAPGEIPFALQAGAPSLPPDAPGSASVRLGAGGEATSPLESWLSILFGPTD